MIEPHGGKLVDRIIREEKEKKEFIERVKGLKKYKISQGDLSVFYRIADGTLSPICGPMNGEEFYHVLDEEYIERDGKRVAWTIPIAFPIDKEDAKRIKVGEELCVCSDKGDIVGSIVVEDIYPFDKIRYLKSVYGTDRLDHPGAELVLKDKRSYLIGGKIFSLPQIWDRRFKKYMLTPKQTRKLFKEKGFHRVIAFQTRNPLHRAHEYAMVYALEKLTKEGYFAGVVLNPILGETKSDDVPREVRMECYRVLIEDGLLGEGDSCEELWREKGCKLTDRALLIGLDMRMFYAGPKEAIMHAIYRQNMGFTDIIIGRRHADAPFFDGTPIWGDFDAQKKFENLAGDLRIKNFNVGFFAYFNELGKVALIDEYKDKGFKPFTISGSKVREALKNGQRPDPRIMRPQVAEILIRYYKKGV